MEALRGTFKPEFLNRIDNIIIFRALAMADIERIIDIQLGLIRKRLQQRNSLELTRRRQTLYSASGYSAVYGARPLKRTLRSRSPGPSGPATSRRGLCRRRPDRDRPGRRPGHLSQKLNHAHRC